MLSDLKAPLLGPLAFTPAELPEVVELFGEDGQRQFALASALNERESLWVPTEAAPLI